MLVTTACTVPPPPRPLRCQPKDHRQIFSFSYFFLPNVLVPAGSQPFHVSPPLVPPSGVVLHASAAIWNRVKLTGLVLTLRPFRGVRRSGVVGGDPSRVVALRR